MNKKLFAFLLAGFAFVLAFSAFSSAYAYYNDYNNPGYYGRYYGYAAYPSNVNNVDYHYSHTTGTGPFATTKTTDYHKDSYTEILPDGTQRKVLLYSRVTTNTPQGYGYYYQPYYRNNYYYNEPSYYRTNYVYGYW